MSEEKKKTPFNNLNKCQFTGNLGADPRVNTKTGRTIVNATLYVTNEYEDAKTHEIKKVTTRFGMVAFGKAADEFLATGPKKGSPVKVMGRMQGKSWTDAKNQPRYDVELHAYKAEVIVPKPKEQPADQPQQKAA